MTWYKLNPIKLDKEENKIQNDIDKCKYKPVENESEMKDELQKTAKLQVSDLHKIKDICLESSECIDCKLRIYKDPDTRFYECITNQDPCNWNIDFILEKLNE